MKTAGVFLNLNLFNLHLRKKIEQLNTVECQRQNRMKYKRVQNNKR